MILKGEEEVEEATTQLLTDQRQETSTTLSALDVIGMDTIAPNVVRI